MAEGESSRPAAREGLSGDARTLLAPIESKRRSRVCQDMRLPSFSPSSRAKRSEVETRGRGDWARHCGSRIPVRSKYWNGREPVGWRHQIAVPGDGRLFRTVRDAVAEDQCGVGGGYGLGTPLTYVTGTVDQDLLARNEYLAAENRILKGLSLPKTTSGNKEQPVRCREPWLGGSRRRSKFS